MGTDISTTVIKRAEDQNIELIGDGKVAFKVDNIIDYNQDFHGRFNLIFSARTLYYCAPEIDTVIANCRKYLTEGGLFGWIYNQTEDAFTNQWLTYDLLIDKLDDVGFELVGATILNYRATETTCVALYRRCK